jgi:hypothetical protein
MGQSDNRHPHPSREIQQRVSGVASVQRVPRAVELGVPAPNSSDTGQNLSTATAAAHGGQWQWLPGQMECYAVG